MSGGDWGWVLRGNFADAALWFWGGGVKAGELLILEGGIPQVPDEGLLHDFANMVCGADGAQVEKQAVL